MSENNTVEFNANFVVDAKKDAILLKFAEKVYKNPNLLSEANIVELSPDNPALASKVLLSAYSRALLAEAKQIDSKNEKNVFDNLYWEYSNVVEAFLEKNRTLFNELSSRQEKGGE